MKFLICGLGRMGRIHKKYLEQLNIEWLYYDPSPAVQDYFNANRLESLSDAHSNNVTHTIISSVEGKHFENYSELRRSGFDGPILIEKPVVLENDHFSVFKDPLVTAGFVERHNPAIEVLKNNIDIRDLVSVDFTRCSVSLSSNHRVDSFTDVGIHDIDLFFYLFGNEPPKEYDFKGFSNTFVLTAASNSGFLSRFIWSNETSFKERKIIARHKQYTLVVDLINQSVERESSDSKGRVITQTLYVEKASPILCQLTNFINNENYCAGEKSHSFYLQLKNNLIY